MIDYGKIITSESYFEGKQTNKQIAYSIPIVVKDKSEILSEIIKVIDLICEKQTHTVKLTVQSGKDFNIKLLTTEYIVDRN